jgi:hypothetical protein
MKGENEQCNCKAIYPSKSHSSTYQKYERTPLESQFCPLYPTGMPSSQPSSRPSLQPSAQPSTSPSAQPSSIPTSQPSSSPTRQPSNQPSSQPSTSPSTQPSSQPSTSPSTQPSSQPTTSPTGQPTSEPTSYPTYQSDTRIVELPTHFYVSDTGVHFGVDYNFTHVGIDNRQHYLTAWVYDTGFGPSTQQYVSFFVKNSKTEKWIPFKSSASDRLAFACAPSTRANGSESGCLPRFHNCFYNWPLSDFIDKHEGGLLTIRATSYGILSSSCPHINKEGSKSAVYVKFELSTTSLETPAPTVQPTVAATTSQLSVQTIDNRLQVNLNEIGFAASAQITFAIAVLFAGIGIALSKIRQKGQSKAVKIKLMKAAIEAGLFGADISSLVFLMLQLYAIGIDKYGKAIIAVRFLYTIAAFYILISIYGPNKINKYAIFPSHLDILHMMKFSKLYGLLSLVLCLDINLIIFLPWKNSEFSRFSNGFPNLFVFRFTQLVTLCVTLLYIGLQIPILRSAETLEEKAYSYLNIALSSIKFLVALLSYILKVTFLTTANTEQDNIGLKKINADGETESDSDSDGSYNSDNDSNDSNRDKDREDNSHSHSLYNTYNDRMTYNPYNSSESIHNTDIDKSTELYPGYDNDIGNMGMGLGLEYDESIHNPLNQPAISNKHSINSTYSKNMKGKQDESDELEGFSSVTSGVDGEEIDDYDYDSLYMSTDITNTINPMKSSTTNTANTNANANDNNNDNDNDENHIRYTIDNIYEDIGAYSIRNDSSMQSNPMHSTSNSTSGSTNTRDLQQQMKSMKASLKAMESELKKKRKKERKRKKNESSINTSESGHENDMDLSTSSTSTSTSMKNTLSQRMNPMNWFSSSSSKNTTTPTTTSTNPNSMSSTHNPMSGMSMSTNNIVNIEADMDVELAVPTTSITEDTEIETETKIENKLDTNTESTIITDLDVEIETETETNREREIENDMNDVRDSLSGYNTRPTIAYDASRDTIPGLAVEDLAEIEAEVEVEVVQELEAKEKEENARVFRENNNITEEDTAQL